MAGSTCSSSFTIQFLTGALCDIVIETRDVPVTIYGYDKIKHEVGFYYTKGSATRDELQHELTQFRLIPADGSAWPTGVTISDITFQHNIPKVVAPISAPRSDPSILAANWVRFSVEVSQSVTGDSSFDALIQLHIHTL